MTPDLAAVVAKVLAELPMSDDGTGHVADCGWDDETMQCGCMTLPARIEAILRAHVAAEVTKRLTATLARSEVVEAVADVIRDECDLGASYTQQARRALAAIPEALGAVGEVER